MALRTINTQGLPGPTAGDLAAVLGELQRLRVNIVAGAAADANIAISGIATEDTILAVLRFDVELDTGTSASGNKVQALDDLTSEAAITSAGNIQLGTTNTTGDTLIVLWYNKTA